MGAPGRSPRRARMIHPRPATTSRRTKGSFRIDKPRMGIGSCGNIVTANQDTNG